MEKEFFNYVFEAIEEEEKTLNRLFGSNSEYYMDNHHGVCNLFETTYVYLTFKKLLEKCFPFKVFWEYPYPSKKNNHSDIALITKEGELHSLIEFKLWINDSDYGIKRDIEKLKSEDGCRKFIFVIRYGGDIEKNHEYLMRDNPPISLVDKKGIKTRFYKYKKNIIEDTELNMFMYEVLENNSEY